MNTYLKVLVRMALYGFFIGIACGALLFVLSGCAIRTDNKVSGTVKHEVSLNVENLRPYFQAACHDKNPGEKCYRIHEDECVDCMIADYIDKAVR